MINFCDFIQVFVFTTNHHLKHGVSRALCIHTPVESGPSEACPKADLSEQPAAHPRRLIWRPSLSPPPLAPTLKCLSESRLIYTARIDG